MAELTTNVAGVVGLSGRHVAHLARYGLLVLALAPDGLGGGVGEVVDGFHGVDAMS